MAVTHDEWGAIFSRMELTWGEISAHRRNHYFEILSDLDGAAVAGAVDRLAREARESVPPPGVIRDYAGGMNPTAPASPGPAATPQPPPTVPPTPIVPAPATVPPGGASIVVSRSSGKATAALVLGIASTIFGWMLLITSILAIIFGAIALSEMKDDPKLTGRGQAMWGLGLGIATLVGWVILFIVAGISGGD